MSWRAIGLVGLLSLAAALGYVDRLAVVAISPTLVKEFDMSDERWGWTNSAFSLVYIFGSVLGGMWIDRAGLKKGLAISIAFWSVAAAGHALATGFWSLCLWRMLLALGEAPGFAAMLKGVRRLMPLHLRDTGSGLISASTVLGAMVAPWVVVPLMGRIGWRAAFVVTAGSGALWLIAWLLLARGEDESLGPQPVKLQTGTEAGRLAWRSLAVWAAVLAIFFTVPPTVFVTHFLPRYLDRTFAVTQQAMPFWLWQVPLATDVGQIMGGLAASGLLARGCGFLASRRLIMMIGFPAASVVLCVNGADEPTSALVWLSVSRFWFMFAYTALITYGMEVVAEQQTALMIGLLNGTFGVSNLLFSPLFGGLADRFDGYREVIWLVGIAPLIGLAVWLVLSHLGARQVISRPAPERLPPGAAR
jgi:ACS family hexuronate transporter-like MFS transporter